MPGRASRTPRDGFGVDGGYVTLRGFLLGCLGFIRDGEYMGEEAESEAARADQTPPRRGQWWGRAWALSGQAAGPPVFSFGLRLRYG